MNRFPSNRLRVEFDGPDVSQEMLYTLFRVSDASRAKLKPAIWSCRRYPAAFTRTSRSSTIRDRRIFQNLPSRHCHQLRKSTYRTVLTPATWLLHAHQHRRLHTANHRRTLAFASHPKPITTVLRKTAQSTRDSRLGIWASENRSSCHCIFDRDSQLHCW